MKMEDLVTEVMNTDVDLTAIAKELDDDDETVVRKVAPGRKSFKAKAIVGAGPEELPQLEADSRRRLAELVEPGRRAVRKILDDGESAKLTKVEHKATEAIVIPMGRPALLVQDGKFFPASEPWSHDLEEQRAEIEAVLGSVGRIELTGHPELDWVGTGWLVNEEVVITNRHVGEVFTRQTSAGKFTFSPGVTSRIDFAEELGGGAPREFNLTGVIGMHEKLDLALLRVAQRSGKKMPPALSIAAKPKVRKGTKVYVIGYPADDSKRNEPEDVRRIFAGIFNVKRLQPGKLRSVPRTGSQIMHDCSTLGGNSGSCVIDMQTHQVIGLHFGGRFLKGNDAVAMWKLADDPLLKKAKVAFA